MVTVATAVSRLYVWEGGAVTRIVDVDAITDASPVFHGIHQDAANGAGGDVHRVVNQAASVGEAGIVAHQKAQTFLLVHWSRRDTSVQPQQVGNRTGVVGPATGADGRLVLDQ